ncbi:unnamed protein product [Didymodactylos carnosus]|uniref:Uncharacterized protein n=1 Tax=Didymodactylos carnosus TaxID=1234261 RepID=A0A8S2J7M7_9BILA|nr:unnamed protein product [Didymodactylos carnosus]CAF3796852.1 unnamed protein product [Didymodactylos carnosus]
MRLPQQKHGRRYHNSSEEDRRRQVFSQRIQHVLSVNSKNLSYKLELNSFSDLTEQEFNEQKKGYIPDPRNYTRNRRSVFMESQGNVTTPASLDWVAMGRVTPPKDQGSCGDCWAFATTAVVEGLLAKKTGMLLNLSTQEIVDCSGSGACNGGEFTVPMRYLISNYGSQTLWADYTYAAVKQDCQASCFSRQIIGPNIGYTNVPSGDEAALLQAVNRGPVFVGINANTSAFQSYKTGVINLSTQDCDPRNIDHAVTLVGYGYDSTLQLNYWKVKNSWSTTWGEGGYGRIARGTNVCGIASFAAEGTL